MERAPLENYPNLILIITERSRIHISCVWARSNFSNIKNCTYFHKIQFNWKQTPFSWVATMPSNMLCFKQWKWSKRSNTKTHARNFPSMLEKHATDWDSQSPSNTIRKSTRTFTSHGTQKLPHQREKVFMAKLFWETCSMKTIYLSSEVNEHKR